MAEIHCIVKFSQVKHSTLLLDIGMTVAYLVLPHAMDTGVFPERGHQSEIHIKCFISLGGMARQIGWNKRFHLLVWATALRGMSEAFVLIYVLFTYHLTAVESRMIHYIL
jgi:hypothetical protein